MKVSGDILHKAFDKAAVIVFSCASTATRLQRAYTKYVLCVSFSFSNEIKINPNASKILYASIHNLITMLPNFFTVLWRVYCKSTMGVNCNNPHGNDAITYISRGFG